MGMLFEQGTRSESKVRRWSAGSSLRRLFAFAIVLAATSVGSESKGPIVDLELVLAVDVSFSMTEEEQQTQRNGYVSALRHPDVAQAISLGRHAMIAIAYVEWAGADYQRVVLPWTIIRGHEDATRFADALAAQPIASKASTSISAGLLFAGSLFADRRSASERQVIDISGDGPNNTGPPIAPVRDELITSGISINGLPISLRRGDVGAFESFGEDYLTSYFERCVIGGPDAFVITVDDLTGFEVAIRRKLVREIAGRPARIWLASYRPPPGPVADCTTVGQVPGR